MEESTRQLAQLMLKVQQIGTTDTSIVLSVPFRRAALAAARDQLGFEPRRHSFG
jgi:hypothetical protein